MQGITTSGYEFTTTTSDPNEPLAIPDGDPAAGWAFVTSSLAYVPPDSGPSDTFSLPRTIVLTVWARPRSRGGEGWLDGKAGR